MRGIRNRVETQVQPRVKKGIWEVFLTDPSLNKFTFGPSLISKYIMTDIVSPYGQKSVLYNTISKDERQIVKIELNFEDIDDANISNIHFRSSASFFTKWEVELRDNRKGEKTFIQSAEDFEVEPAIKPDKLFGLGFINEGKRARSSYFELHLTRK